MTTLEVRVTKNVTMEAFEEIHIEDLWEFNLTELMEDVDYQEIDSEIIDTEVVAT